MGVCVSSCSNPSLHISPSTCPPMCAPFRSSQQAHLHTDVISLQDKRSYLLFLVRLGDSGLADDLASVDLVVTQAQQLVAPCESSL